MKIAIVHFGRKGAGPVYSLEMAKSLYKFGHEIFYYASEAVENKKYILEENFQHRFFVTYDSRISYLKSIISRKSISRIIKSIKNDNPDIIYSTMNDLWTPFVFPKLKMFTRVKTIHDVGIHEGNNSLFNKWWNTTNFKDAEKFVILSRKYVTTLEQRGIHKSNICVIPHSGFDYYCKVEDYRKFNYSSDLLFFGRIDKYKGINILLKAMKTVIAKFPYVKLNIVGNGDLSSYSSSLNELQNNIKVYNRWIKDEEVAGFVNQTKFVVIPYIHATQSGVIPLAYAFSKPVISTDVGCLSEQVIDGETGILVPEVDSELFADAIIKMLDDKNRTIRMGKSAHDYMLTNLTWDSAAKKLINFLSR